MVDSKTRSLKWPWLVQSFHATHTAYSRGVSVLLARSLRAEVVQIKADPEGRYVVLMIQISSVTITLVTVYVPPPFSADVLVKLSLMLLSRPPGALLYVGDFNAVMSPAMDRLGGGGRSYHSFTDWAQVHGLTEIWRWKHPDECQFSCHSDSFHTMSRIDLAFGTRDTLLVVSSITYLPRGVSDHAPLAVDLLLLPGNKCVVPELILVGG